MAEVFSVLYFPYRWWSQKWSSPIRFFSSQTSSSLGYHRRPAHLCQLVQVLRETVPAHWCHFQATDFKKDIFGPVHIHSARVGPVLWDHGVLGVPELARCHQWSQVQVPPGVFSRLCFLDSRTSCEFCLCAAHFKSPLRGNHVIYLAQFFVLC